MFYRRGRDISHKLNYLPAISDLTAHQLNGYSSCNENDDIGGPAGQARVRLFQLGASAYGAV
jgi:hypothetical protein